MTVLFSYLVVNLIRVRDLLCRCTRAGWCVASASTLIMITQSACAGGSFGEIKLSQYEADRASDTRFTFVASIVSRWDAVSSCEQIEVTGDFDSIRWQAYDRPMSKKTHIEALSMLRSSIEAGETIRFGTMGAGLKRTGDCRYESKGLFVENHRDDPLVFSVHFPI